MGEGLLALFVANFIGGALTPTFVKFGVTQIPPLTFTEVRYLLAIAILLPFYLKQKKDKLHSNNIKGILLCSLFFALNVGLFSIAIQYTTIIMSQILYAFVPVIVGILGHFILKEKFTKNKIIGSIVAFLGLLFLLYQSFVREENLTFGSPAGNILIIIAVFSWSLYLIFSRKNSHTHTAITNSFASFLVTAIVLFPIIPFELSYRSFNLDQITILGYGSLLGVGILSSVVMIFLIQTGIRLTNAFTTSLFSYTAPFFASVAGILIFGEKITITLIIGGFFILFGVFYATSYEYLMNRLKKV